VCPFNRVARLADISGKEAAGAFQKSRMAGYRPAGKPSGDGQTWGTRQSLGPRNIKELSVDTLRVREASRLRRKDDVFRPRRHCRGTNVRRRSGFARSSAPLAHSSNHLPASAQEQMPVAGSPIMPLGLPPVPKRLQTSAKLTVASSEPRLESVNCSTLRENPPLVPKAST
jgi:hypothetical protein